MQVLINRQSTNKTANALVKTGPGYVDCITVSYDETAEATIELADSITSGGTALFKCSMQGSVNDECITLWPRFNFKTGLYITLANCEVSISYE